MSRPKKDYKSLNVKLDSKIMERLEKYCDIMGQTKTTALERILQKHLDDFDKILVKKSIKPNVLYSLEGAEIK